ncbi:rhomboid family intramembrane serine protease [Streptomyces sp. NPDC087917]|uniref:rhomboid family intramembrane serine protease n=1 Tax=Streptomyces sp. NPDC087917 TaxID=3155060 RepID=UPI00342B90AC
MVVLGVAQAVAPAVIDALERHPHGAWWRAVTALMVQSSGWPQLLFNLGALAVVAPVAERQVGPWRMVLIFATSGVMAQAVSMAGWSLQGGGDSVAICGLVGALGTWHLVRGARQRRRPAVGGSPHSGRRSCPLPPDQQSRSGPARRLRAGSRTDKSCPPTPGGLTQCDG